MGNKIVAMLKNIINWKEISPWTAKKNWFSERGTWPSAVPWERGYLQITACVALLEGMAYVLPWELVNRKLCRWWRCFPRSLSDGERKRYAGRHGRCRNWASTPRSCSGCLPWYGLSYYVRQTTCRPLFLFFLAVGALMFRAGRGAESGFPCLHWRSYSLNRIERIDRVRRAPRGSPVWLDFLGALRIQYFSQELVPRRWRPPRISRRFHSLKRA